MRKGIFWLILVFIVYIIIEVFSLFSLFLLKEVYHIVYSPTLTTSLSDINKKNLTSLITNKTYSSYITYDPILGWSIKKNGVFGGIYRANSQGIRANKEYQLIPSKNVVRISCFGDSFTHGSEVKNEYTWQEQINTVNKDLEVINFGVGGYGLDQAMLRYQQDGILYNSHIVFIGYIPALLYRNVNVFCPFMTPDSALPLTKPRFVIENERLVLINNPIHELSQYKNLLNKPEVFLPKLGANDYYFQSSARYKKGVLDFLPSVRLFKMGSSKLVKYIDSSYIVRNGYYNKDSEAFKLTIKLFDEFFDSVVDNNSLPVIILLPTRKDIIQYRKKRTTSYKFIRNYFETKGYQYIDALNAFDIYSKDLKLGDLFMPKNHYSALANKLVAKYILKYLQEKDLVNLTTVKHKLDNLKLKNGQPAKD
ncbi:MAG: SGNH/GDSL hydrolase family protein [Candidatus Scalindua sp.]